MKRRLACVIAILLIAVGCSSSIKAPASIAASAAHDNQFLWRAVGDSTLAGDNGQPGVASLLQNMRNASVRGATLVQAVRRGRPDRSIAWLRDVINYANTEYGIPRKILIHGGAADSGAKVVGLSPFADQVYFDEITYLTKALTDLKVDVYWVNVVPPAFSTAAVVQDMRSFRQTLQAFLKRSIPAGHLIDCNPAIDTNGDGWMDEQFAWSQIDRNHFSPDGTKVYSDCLAKKLGLAKRP
jgi:hypothetical protein